MYSLRAAPNDEGPEDKEASEVGPGPVARRKMVPVPVQASDRGSSPVAGRSSVAVAGQGGGSTSVTSGDVTDPWDTPTSPTAFEDGTHDGGDGGEEQVGAPHQGVEEMGRRGAGSGRNIKRWKNRTNKLDRLQQQVPVPFQQQQQQQQMAVQRNLKAKVPRPPLHASRKRRCGPGKVLHTMESHMSEGDMNQADEMGEGVDEGFTDGAEMLKRRKRKQQLQQLQGGLHVLVPSISDGTHGTPPSSPSGTPVSRRRSSSRKIRPKPRSKKSVKQAVPASADISSTQETTTPGPGSSDTTDSPDETLPECVPNCAECEPEATTPHCSSFPAMEAEVQSPFPLSTVHLSDDVDAGALNTSPRTSNRTDVIHTVSDTDKDWGTSHNKQSPGTKQWNSSNHANHSEVPAAPYSSGTSDVETSGNERISESTSDLSGLREVPRPTAQRSRNGCNSTSSGDEGARGASQGTKPPTSRKPPNLLQLQVTAVKPSLSSSPSVPQRGLRHHHVPSSPSLSAHSTASPGDVSPEPRTHRSSNLSSSKPKPPVATKPANLRQMSSAFSAPNLRKVTSFRYDEQAKEIAHSEDTTGSIGHIPTGSIGHIPTGSIGHTPTGSTGHTPTGSTGQTPTGSISQTPVEVNPVSPGDASGISMEAVNSKQPVVGKEMNVQSMGAEVTGVQTTSDQRPSAKPSQGGARKPALPPKRAMVREGSEDSAVTPLAGVQAQHLAPRSAHSSTSHPLSPSSSDTSASKPVPRPAVLGRRPAVPAKPKVQAVLSTGLAKAVDDVASKSVVEVSTVTSSTEPESKAVLQDGTESKPVVQVGLESQHIVQAESDLKPVEQDAPGSKSSIMNGPLMHLTEIADTRVWQCEVDPLVTCNQPPPPPPHATSSSPMPTGIPTADQREQSSPGDQSSSASQDSGQELTVSGSPVPQKTSTMRRSPRVGVCISSHPSPTNDSGGLGRRNKGQHPDMDDPPPPPLPPPRDASPTAASDDTSCNPSSVALPAPGQGEVPTTPEGEVPTTTEGEIPTTSELECRGDPAKRSKSVKRFQLREEGVPRTFSASSKRHYEDVEFVATIPRKDTGSKRAGPPKPPKTYATDEGVFSPAGTPPPTCKAPSPPSARAAYTTNQPRQPAMECPPPLPSAPIPHKKDRLNSYKRVCDSPGVGSQRGSMSHLRHHPLSQNEVASGSKSSLTSNEGSNPSLGEMEPYYESVQSESTALERLPSSYSPALWMEHYDVSDNFRKSWSGNFKHSLTTTECVSKSDEEVPRPASGGLHRTISLDSMNSRRQADKIVFKDTDESSDEGIISPSEPTPTGLPEVPQTYFAGNTAKTFEAYDEPLYQYINTAEFLPTEPHHTHRQQSPKTQLDVARAQRKLWCEQKEVMESGVLGNLSDEEKKLQEAMYEVVMSEATYLRSLDVLIEHFMDDPGMNPSLPEGRRVMTKREHHVIFSNIGDVRQASARFLADLQVRQKESLVIANICDIILNHAKDKFDCYIPYCTNQIYQSRELQRLIENNVMFREYLKRLESHKRCQNLSMQSFLLLPMQRITRLPLLILAIFNRTPPTHPEYDLVEQCLRTIQKLVTQCNDGARKLERTEQLHDIYRQMVFAKLKPFPLVSVSRQLERKGPLFRLQVEQKLFGKVKIKKTQLFIFSFTDYIFITKKKTNPKGESTYTVIDHGSRAVVEVEDLECRPGVTFPKHTFGEQTTVAQATWAVSTANVSDAFLVILLDNAYHKSEKYIFVAQNSTDKTRWMESIQRPHNEGEEEKIYEHWDCPQVQALYDYHSEQPDELSLERGDIVKVFRKMADGWYEGERLRDRQWGWFPSNFTTEIHSEHTRARNLRETHKLLSLPFTPEEFSAQIQSMT